MQSVDLSLVKPWAVSKKITDGKDYVESNEFNIHRTFDFMMFLEVVT